MSQVPGSDPSAGKEGLSKYMKRLSSVLRRPGSKRSSVASVTAPSGTESAKATTSTPAPAAATSSAAAAAPAKSETAQGPVMTYAWSAIQQERARALFAKYGLTLEPEEWMSPRNIQVQRVEKPIRMRVRRICHRCQTTYGPDKVCGNCQHVRCKKCPRYPPKKPEQDIKGKGKENVGAPTANTATPATPAAAPRKQKAPPLAIPSRTGGQDRILQPSRQRVRRTCHRCGTLFRGHATECVTCTHIRCKKCPREPAKLDKYPDGYPGDVEPPSEPPPRVWKKPRRRLRYYCHKCSTMYSPGDDNCGQCGQERGTDTIRDPPKKVKPPPDPDVLRRVEERLAAFALSRQ